MRCAEESRRRVEVAAIGAEIPSRALRRAISARREELGAGNGRCFLLGMTNCLLGARVTAGWRVAFRERVETTARWAAVPAPRSLVGRLQARNFRAMRGVGRGNYAASSSG